MMHVAALPPSVLDDRRGIAVTSIAIKVAGGAASECDWMRLSVCAQAVGNLRSMGVLCGGVHTRDGKLNRTC